MNCNNSLVKTFMVMKIVLLLLAVTALQADADILIPPLINYQGYLVDSGGIPLNDTVTMTFSIYDTPEEGAPVWTETMPAVFVSKGVFNVMLGSSVPFDAAYLGEERYLGIQVGSDPEMTPRQQIISVAYAIAADWANKASALNDGISRSGSIVQGAYGENHVNLGTNSVTGGAFTDNQYCTVGGGETNLAEGDATTVSGGSYNQALADYATIGGGGPSDQGNPTTSNNRVFDRYGTVGGGGGNLAGSDDNDPTSAPFATVGGGSGNSAGNFYSMVGGGTGNAADGYGAAVVGGTGNSANSNYAVVGGGAGNTAENAYATVSGGNKNTASGSRSAIGGGFGNDASGAFATIGGGLSNIAAGNYSSINGGMYNIAMGDYSWTGGKNMQLASGADRTFVWGYADSAQNITTSDAFLIFPAGTSGSVGIGTTTPSAALDVNGTVAMTGLRMPSGASDGYVLKSDASGIGTWREDIDNDSGGDITSVNAGTGLNGGGESGEVTLNVNVPLELSGSTAGDVAVIKGMNNGSGYGLYGWSAYNYGVYGHSNAISGVIGYSGAGAGVEGLNGSYGNQGQLGTNDFGVYGKGATSSSTGVYGLHNLSGNVGKLGTSNEGVYGLSSAMSGAGVAGINSGSGSGVYGNSTSGYAGYFDGKVRVNLGEGPQVIIHDLDGGGTRPGIQFTNNTEQNISGDDQSTEYFKFYSAYNRYRDYDAIVRIYGKAEDSWDRSLGLTHDGSDGIVETDYGDLFLKPADGQVWIPSTLPILTLNSLQSAPATAYTLLNFSQNEVVKWQMAWNSKDQRLYWSNPAIGDALMIYDQTGNIETGASLYVNGNLNVAGEIVTDRQGRLTVSPLEFRPMDSTWNYSVTGDSLTPKLAWLPPAPVFPFNAPVMLPDGVTVNKIIVNWTDSDPDNGMCMTLDRATHNEGTGSRLATTCCNGSIDERKLNYSTEIDNAVIDNVLYKYYLTLNIGGTTDGKLKIHGVRIQYTHSTL